MTQPTSPADRPTFIRHQLLRKARLLAKAAPTGVAEARKGPTDPERGVAMRTPHGRAAGSPLAVPAAPAAAVIALRRMGFGPWPGDVDAFNTLGGNDAQRMEAYVDQQLDPASIDDSAAEARLTAANFQTLGKSLTQLWADHVVADPEWQIRMQPFFETERATFLRAVNSRRQLLELMVDFWHNHFNVYAYDFSIGPTWVYTDRDVIRANALGNFRVMLELVAQSPGMLYYLDNRSNSADGPNENYARELLELHTLGAENYYGSIPQAEVPVDGDGKPLGYVDEDVTGAARCLTGWTLRDRDWHPDFGDTGEFFVYEDWHDDLAKSFLGSTIGPGQGGLQDGRDLLDLIAGHPGTGRFVARKLCRRLIGDSPPQSVIDLAAGVFTDNVSAPDQIAQVLRAILLSSSFVATWADKVRRPFESVTAALRATAADWDFSLASEDTDTLDWLYYQTGQPLFSWHPPNGYPDFKQAWITTSPRVMTWRVLNWLSGVRDDQDNYRLDILGQTPVNVRSANDLADFWARRVLGEPMPEEEQTELVEFMAQGRNPDLDLPLDTDEDTQNLLRAMVGLIFMSPAFWWR